MIIEFGIEVNVLDCLGLDDADLAEFVEESLRVVAHQARWRMVDTIKREIYNLETERLLPMCASETVN